MAFKILVCAKQVPNTNEIKINPETGALIRDGVPSILNTDDANAVELALEIKDKYDDVHVTIVSMGPPQATEMLFECIAMGADEAVLLSDRAVGGSDTWATSNALSATINTYVEREGGYDLILGGRQAIDGDTAQVGPQIAEKLGLPQVTYVEEFEMNDNRTEIIVKRKLEDGYEKIKINPDKIGAVIGKGGEVINKITAETGAEIDIKEDGLITVASPDGASIEKAMN